MARPLKEKVKHRRTWTKAQKKRWVKETMRPGVSVSEVARRADVSVSQLSQWRSEILKGGLPRRASGRKKSSETSRVRELERRVRELEREVEDLKAAVATQSKADNSKRIEPITNEELAEAAAKAGITNEEIAEISSQGGVDVRKMYLVLRKLPPTVRKRLKQRNRQAEAERAAAGLPPEEDDTIILVPYP